MEWGGIKTLEIILFNKCFICLRQQYILFSKCREKGEILKHWEIISKKIPPFFRNKEIYLFLAASYSVTSLIQCTSITFCLLPSHLSNILLYTTQSQQSVKNSLPQLSDFNNKTVVTSFLIICKEKSQNFFQLNPEILINEMKFLSTQKLS